MAFVSDRDGNEEIYVMDYDGANPVRLTNNGARDVDPAWSPDGSQIVFASTRDDPEPELYVMDSDGTGVARITTNTLADTEPNWSPNGTTIAFSRPIFTQAGYVPGIWTIAPNGTGEAAQMTTSVNTDANWSPSGGVLAFSRVYPSFINLEVHAGGTRLTTIPGPDVGAAWSPDGTRIVFASAQHDVDPDNCAAACRDEIYVMNADGSGQTRLTNNAADDERPDWQPQSGVGGSAGLPDVVPPANGGAPAVTIAGLAAGVVAALGGAAWLTRRRTPA
jgi:TolB protein